MTINSVSAAAAAYLQQTQAAKPKQETVPAQSSPQDEDTVQLSPQARAAASQDVDHH